MDVVFKSENNVFNLRVAGIWIKNGHVLIHRLASESIWSLPGGRIKLNEESHISLKREFIEELGIEVDIEKMMWTVENFFHYNGKDIHEVGLYYKVKSEQKIIHMMNKSFYGREGDRLIFKWVPIENLEEIELYPEFLRTKLKDFSTENHFIVK
ncbi:NUDIX hydrolase [Bacillus sp. AFS002410]|uniref:NUDIX hydrolase n=1 Tax=Bacillus sp. AFS002410 TaxID=2033481 RepID=UPI000BF1A039|nr:NUDIX hydrolase [Bacillus sp. AFS002410]PEJ60655.1 NUDIX hydrolase [Bacillus sp. AFS002410]